MIRSCTLRRRPMSVCPTCRPKCCRKCCLGVLLCSVVALTHTYSSPPLLARGSSCTSDMNRGLHTHARFFSRHTPPRHIHTHIHTHTHTHYNSHCSSVLRPLLRHYTSHTHCGIHTITSPTHRQLVRKLAHIHAKQHSRHPHPTRGGQGCRYVHMSTL